MEGEVQSKLVCLMCGQGNLYRVQSVICGGPSEVFLRVELSAGAAAPAEIPAAQGN